MKGFVRRSVFQWPQCLDCLGIHKFPRKSQGDNAKLVLLQLTNRSCGNSMVEVPDSEAAVSSSYPSPKSLLICP